MADDFLRTELHDMSEKIKELQYKSEHLTNGQRYAAINEIEKSIQPLHNDLRKLEYRLYTQQHNNKQVKKDIERIVEQINELESIKSDLNARIHTENEHTRQELNDRILNFMTEELSPIKANVENNKKEIQGVKEDVYELRLDIVKQDKNREVREAARFDKFKILITAVVAALTALSAISLWLEPSIRTLMHIFL